MDYLLLVIGLLLLIFGADGLVKGAARLAANLGVPSLVIGLTVVAFGTSAPELAVSIQSAVSGKSELALANVVGSNIFNILFILGLAAIITPLAISKQLIRQDVPIMVAITGLVFLLALDGVVSIIDCLILTTLLVAYTVFLFWQGKKTDISDGQSNDDVSELTDGEFPVWQSALWLICGLALLILGANLLVSSAVNIARAFAISEAIIGLTIVAIGTSLPEVVTSIVASFKGQRDIAVGNVVGSNTFNLLAVLGISGLFSGDGLLANAGVVAQDLPIMFGVAVLCLPLMFTGATLNRLEGTTFFTLYITYTALLIGQVTNAAWLPIINSLIWSVILPMTMVIVLVSFLSCARSKQRLPD